MYFVIPNRAESAVRNLLFPGKEMVRQQAESLDRSKNARDDKLQTAHHQQINRLL